MLWLLEHVRLWVDPLKDAAGSPFGKADRLYLYLRVQKLWLRGEHQHHWDIDVHGDENFNTLKYGVKTGMDMGMGHLWLKYAD